MEKLPQALLATDSWHPACLEHWQGLGWELLDRQPPHDLRVGHESQHEVPPNGVRHPMPSPLRLWVPQVSVTSGGDQGKAWANILRCQGSTEWKGQQGACVGGGLKVPCSQGPFIWQEPLHRYAHSNQYLSGAYHLPGTVLVALIISLNPTTALWLLSPFSR